MCLSIKYVSIGLSVSPVCLPVPLLPSLPPSLCKSFHASTSCPVRHLCYPVFPWRSVYLLSLFASLYVSIYQSICLLCLSPSFPPSLHPSLSPQLPPSPPPSFPPSTTPFKPVPGAFCDISVGQLFHGVRGPIEEAHLVVTAFGRLRPEVVLANPYDIVIVSILIVS